MEGYNTELQLRIDWSELDIFAHVNNVAFFKYMQAARVNYWDITGISETYTKTNIGPMLASASCQFKKPLFYPGNIRILTKVDFIKTSSFGFSHAILNDSGELAAIAQDVMVLYNFTTNEKVAVPENLRRTIEALEQRLFPVGNNT